MRVTAGEWAARVGAWQSSGLRAEEFAAGKDFDAKSLRWWSSKMRRRQSKPASPPGEATRPAKAKGATFARVVRRSQAPVPPRPEIVVLVGRCRVAVERGFDVQLLGDVVRALAEVSS